jgi:hypothetical protein
MILNILSRIDIILFIIDPRSTYLSRDIELMIIIFDIKRNNIIDEIIIFIISMNETDDS